ncbi:hypothetical protein POM88_038526 [Heracleum sosnowskyi]|uniref:HECT-type E3 ubiquitin transferase n=1 Tax=Heracleum sosnowskyi TaxID=360622 RepID=A0AAD8HBD7_9APIA|nr:hypothetical protein POM88_038526 [Heracleum sosnowskyi]
MVLLLGQGGGSRLKHLRAEEKYPNFFRCFGRLLALAIIHEIQIGITLDRTFFRQLAENDINLEDIKETAPTKFKLYSGILLASERDFQGYTLYGGVDKKQITFEEREEFIAKEICAEFVDCIKVQTGQIIEGIDDIISFPKRTEIFQIIRLEDLDCMIRGIQELNTEDWITSTIYEGYMDKDPVIKWFWQCVADLSEERKRKLLFFWAAVKYLPVGGFEALNPRLVIRNRHTAKEVSLEHLPVSNTCVSTLTFPPYESYDVMQQKLLFVIDHASLNFELR